MKANYIDPALYNIAIEDIPELEKKFKELAEGKYKFLNINKIILENINGDGLSPCFMVVADYSDYARLCVELEKMSNELGDIDPVLYQTSIIQPISLDPKTAWYERDLKAYNDLDHIVYQKG